MISPMAFRPAVRLPAFAVSESNPSITFAET